MAKNPSSSPADRPGDRPRRGLVLGCGGTLGLAWTVSALAAVETALDFDARDADVLQGTSAGAELVTLLGAGIGTAEILAALRGDDAVDPVLAAHLAVPVGRFPRLPSLRPGNPRLAVRRRLSGLTRAAGLAPIGRGDAQWLGELADTLHPGPEWLGHRHARMIAVDLETGMRTVFGAVGPVVGGEVAVTSPVAPLAPAATAGQALRASWAIPGWFPPVQIAGRRYIDGGAASTASVDLLAGLDLDEVIVLAPMASARSVTARGVGRIERRLLRRPMSAGLHREVAFLRSTGVQVARIDLTADDLAVMGPNLMDGRRRAATLERAATTVGPNVLAALDEAGIAAPGAQLLAPPPPEEPAEPAEDPADDAEPAAETEDGAAVPESDGTAAQTADGDHAGDDGEHRAAS